MMRIVTKDIAAYQRLMDGLLSDGLGVKRYYSYVVTKSIKRSAVPLDLIDPRLPTIRR